MNHQYHYNTLIQTRKERSLSKDVYYEKHHIVMRSMGGTDDEHNLVMLTAREHYLAHWLLWKIHNNRETSAAFGCMSNMLLRRNGYMPSSRLFEESRIAASEFAKIHTSNRNISYWSNLTSDERKINTSHLHTTDVINRRASTSKLTWSNKSADDMQVFSDKLIASKSVKKEENRIKTQLRLDSRCRLYPEVTCPNCNKSGKSGVMKRWHFDKCNMINHGNRN